MHFVRLTPMASVSTTVPFERNIPIQKVSIEPTGRERRNQP